MDSGGGGGVTHVEVLALSVTGKRMTTPRLPPEQQVLKILSLQWEPARENQLLQLLLFKQLVARNRVCWM